MTWFQEMDYGVQYVATGDPLDGSDGANQLPSASSDLLVDAVAGILLRCQGWWRVARRTHLFAGYGPKRVLPWKRVTLPVLGPITETEVESSKDRRADFSSSSPVRS